MYRCPLAARLLALFLALTVLWGCDNEIEINAEEKPVIAVYGVLNPSQPVQTIRVARGFLIEGDVIQYAAATDLSLKDALVTLTDNTGLRDTLDPVEIQRQPGDFSPAYTAFQTSKTIVPGRTYTLEVNVPGNDALYAKAVTTVPATPIWSPRDTLTILPGNVQAYPEVKLESDYTVGFFKRNTGDNAPEGHRFEVRLFLSYGLLNAPGDTTWVSEPLRWGPSEMFESSTITPCNYSGGLCYRVSKNEVITFWNSKLPTDKPLVYRNQLKAQSVRVEVTAVEEKLYNYIYINNPTFVDFTTARPQYTNIEGKPGSLNVGIFGAINTASRYIRLSPCTAWRLGLNGGGTGASPCQ